MVDSMKEVEEGRRKSGRVGGRRKRQGMGGAQAQRKNGRTEEGDVHLYTMTDLHTIVVNSFVF